jgi:hypothetical protein
MQTPRFDQCFVYSIVIMDAANNNKVTTITDSAERNLVNGF